MGTRQWTRRAARVAGFAVVLTLALAPLAHAAVPSTPTIRDAWVSAVGKVTVRWDASVDASGHAVGYDVYRDTIPVTSATVISRSLTPVLANYLGTTSPPINAAAAETTQSYTWFYAVVARDDRPTPLYSAFSGNMAPNLHGYRNDPTIVSCARCHQVHGAYLYDYRTKEFCYTCHGDTTAAVATGAKSTWNVQKEFSDYVGQTLGSRHRNAYMTTNKTECVACHSAHRSSYLYDSAGVYVPASSYRMMLRVKYGLSLYNYYSKNSAPATANEFCLSCHGSTVVFDGKSVDASTSIALAGGPSAFANTGGNHNTANYAASAHGGAAIYSNDYDGSAATTDNPAVQCEVCHDNHGSATTRLVDYRRSRTTNANANKQAALCYKCHSASSTEAKVAAGYVKPFAWNARDVQAEFARTSHHPAYTAASGASLTCVSCHNVHYTKAEKASGVWDMDRASDPENTKNVVTSTTYGSAPTDFCMKCHDGTTPAATTTVSVVVPFTATFSSVTAPYFPGWNKNATGFSFGNSGHRTASVANGQALCETCHDPHGSNNKRLNAWTRPTGATWTGGNSIAGSRVNTGTAATEQNLCYKCHGDGSATYPLAIGAKNVYTKAKLTYAHDPDDYAGKHTDTETAALLGGTNRHAECTDCHDPHVTKKVSSSALHTVGSSIAGGALYGAWGAQVAYNATTWGTPSSFTPQRLSGATGHYEANLCFKCHSTNTTQPSGQTNVAQEFNPSNASFHNVLGQGTGMQSAFTLVDSGGTTRNVTWALPPAANFLLTGNGWTANSMLTCTDCHTNTQTSATQASGPHGSSAQWIIDPGYADAWRTTYLSATANGMSNATNICAKCHDLNGPTNATWSNTAHARTQHQTNTRGLCNNCHIGVPHGWKRPRLLGYTGDGTYATRAGTLSQIDFGGYTTSGGSVQWVSSDCYASGCGAQHQAAVSPYWP